MNELGNSEFAAELRRVISATFGSGRPDPRDEETFVMLFRLLGDLARIDGEVEQEETALVYTLLGESGASGPLCRRVIEAYRGDASHVALRTELERYLEMFPRGSRQVTTMLENLIALAHADGLLEKEERHFLEELIGWLGIPTEELDSMVAAVEAPKFE